MLIGLRGLGMWGKRGEERGGHVYRRFMTLFKEACTQEGKAWTRQSVVIRQSRADTVLLHLYCFSPWKICQEHTWMVLRRYNYDNHDCSTLAGDPTL